MIRRTLAAGADRRAGCSRPGGGAAATVAIAAGFPHRQVPGFGFKFAPLSLEFSCVLRLVPEPIHKLAPLIYPQVYGS